MAPVIGLRWTARIRARARTLPVALALVVSACVGATVGSWQGTDVHLVDGNWIGTEHECGDEAADLVCRTIVEMATAALPPEVRESATKVVVTDLPSTFVTVFGETRPGQLVVGIETGRRLSSTCEMGRRR